MCALVECMRVLKGLKTIFTQPRFSKISSLSEENHWVVNNQELEGDQEPWYSIHFINRNLFSVWDRLGMTSKWAVYYLKYGLHWYKHKSRCFRFLYSLCMHVHISCFRAATKHDFVAVMKVYVCDVRWVTAVTQEIRSLIVCYFVKMKG